jgi:hypothetical protein
MQFVGIDYWAVFLAGVAGYIIGAVWYWALSKPWLAAVGLSKETVSGRPQKPRAAPFVFAFIADIVMAWVLAGLMGHLGQVTLINGVISGAFVWLGFVITTLAVNNSFAMRKPILIAIDGGHWLLVLVAMGAVIGGIGLG